MSRRAAWAALVLIAGLLAVPAFASEEGGHDAHGSVGWKTANFVLLAAGLGWLARKYGGPFFRERTRSIRKQMVEAEEIRAEADRRTAEVEARLANLEAEIEAMREEALAEQRAESERFSQRLSTEMAKVREHAEAEIEGAGKQARLELKRYAAELAIGLAEARIRERMTAETQDALVRSFVEGIEPPAAGPRPT